MRASLLEGPNMSRNLPRLALCFAIAASVHLTFMSAFGQATEAPAAAESSKSAAAIGSFGVDLTTLKPSVKPGDDFFAYANGSWYDTFVIPEDRSSYGSFTVLDERARQQVREIIEEAAAKKPAAGTPEQRVGDYYATFMDEAGIEASGLEPAKPDLTRIQSAASKTDVARLFGTEGIASTFAVAFYPDFKDPNSYNVFIFQAGLGLPDRDYYLKDDDKLKEIRAQYVAFMEQMLTLGGGKNAAADAQAIMAFETEIARRQWPIEKQRDYEAVYNPRTRAEVLAQAPGFEWPTFFEVGGLGKRDKFVLAEITAIQDIAKLIDATPLETLKAYMTFHYLSDHAPYLPARIDDANFAFYGQTLRGQPKKRERWKRGVDLVNGAMGEQVGQVYVQKHFPPDSKAKMQDLVANLRAALAVRIDKLAWMTPETKKRAHEKLATFVTKIGYPDKWKDYSSLVIKRGDLIGNVHRAQRWQWDYEVARLDKPVDKSEWGMAPQEVNAYYNPQNNEIVFPAAILQPPFFDPNADAAVNFGAIGAVIGHEIGHGFDDQGRKFAPDGSMTDWWSEKDATAFTSRADMLIKQYSSFEALPGLNVKGQNTIGENIGDLGGLNMAYEAYHMSLKGKEAPVIQGLTGDQRFFLSFAQIWRAKYRDGALRELVMSDPHSPPYFRLNGTVRNMDAWYTAFDVKPGSKLYLKPEERVSIW
jgi:predicted metalloendopeptidase